MVLLLVSLKISLVVSHVVLRVPFACGVAISWVLWLSRRAWYIPGMCFGV